MIITVKCYLNECHLNKLFVCSRRTTIILLPLVPLRKSRLTKTIRLLSRYFGAGPIIYRTFILYKVRKAKLSYSESHIFSELWIILHPQGRNGVEDVLPYVSAGPLWQRRGPVASAAPGAVAPLIHA